MLLMEELRPLNLLRYRKGVVVVTTLDFYMEEVNGILLKDLKGIFVTRNILNKIPLKKLPENIHYDQRNGYRFLVGDKYIKCKYLHHLQNVYHMFNDEDLDVSFLHTP